MICVVLACVIFCVFRDVATHDFANIDDQDYVFENAYVQKGFTLETIIWAFTPSTKENRSYWHPLTWLSHMLDCSMFGLDAGKHHLVGLGMHTVSAILLFLVFFQMTGALWKSAFVAALFAIHPLNVESVAWIAERKNVLSTFFWLLTLLAYFYYTRRPGILRYFLILLAFILGLLSKPMLVTLPVILLLMDIWPLYRLSTRDSFRRLAIEKMPMVVLACITFAFVFFSLQTNNQVLETGTIPMTMRFANALASALKYIIKIFWPHPLVIYYPFPDHIPLWRTLGAGAILAAITTLAVIKVKTTPWFFVGWFWFLVALSPVSGMIQGGLWPEMADRWSYVPAIGLFVIIAWGFDSISRNLPNRKPLTAVVAVAVLLSLTMVTLNQLKYWENPRVMFERALEATPENPVAYFGYGNGLEKEGRTDEAIEQYYNALRLKNDFLSAHMNLGNIFYRKGQYDKAIYHYSLAEKFQPHSAKTQSGLANVYAAAGNFENALTHYTKALAIELEDPVSHYNMGVAYYKLYQYDKAIDHFKTAIRLQPDYESAKNALDMIYHSPMH
jgi:Tfp pilus assembly protein PilF